MKSIIFNFKSKKFK